MIESVDIGVVTWLSAICVVICTLIYSRRSTKNFPPGPRGLPLVGYIPFLGKHPAVTYQKLGEKFGPVFSVNIGPQTWIVLNDYDCIHEALVKHGEAFSGRPLTHIPKETSKGYGILFRTHDDSFKIQRRFALASLRGFGVGKRSMEDRITEEIGYLSKVIESKSGKSFDSQSILSTSVSNVICSIVMGSRFSYDDKRFQSMIFTLNKAFSKSFDNTLRSMLLICDPLRHIPPFSGAYKRLMDDTRLVVGILQEILDEHKESFDEQNIRDFIDIYLKEINRGKQSHSSFKEIQLLNMMRDFFIAGTETTASTLRWCFLCFAQFPEIQKKVWDELRAVIGEAIPSMEHKKRMPYTSSFLHEITRHRTLVQLALPHLTTKDVVFRGFEIPKGTPVFPNLYAANHDAKYFVNPNKFDPERFINEDGKFVHDEHVIPFSVGPRFCLGQQLATMELFLFITNIVQRFEIVADTEKPLPSFFESFSGNTEVTYPYEVFFKIR